MAAALFVSRSRPWNAGAIAGNAVLGPFAEEVLFRGVLFLGLRAAGWRLWSALAVSAIAFALAHPLEFEQLADLVSWGVQTGWGAYAATTFFTDMGPRLLMFAAGGVLFGWLVHRFDSLWPAIGLHAFINLWWQLHLGPAHPFATAIDWMTAAHGLSVVLAVVLALRWTRPARPQSSMSQSSIPSQSSITDHQSSM
jgi:membrane protease YdiL (CAAX protease family)